MDYLPILEQFKKDHIRAGEVLPLSSIPFLFHELKKCGMTLEDVNNDFYKSAIQVLFAEEERGLQFYAVEYLFYHSQILELAKVKKESVEPKNTFRPTNSELPDIMPPEEEEGDGLYIPPEDIITVNPDELPKYQIDWDIAESIGMQRPENE